MQDVAISTSYSIADVRNSGAEKRNSSYTGEFEIPSCHIVDRLFEFCFELDIALSNFNPNLKTSARYEIDNVGIIDGDLQLLRIVEHPEGHRVYVCSLTGLNAALFFAIGDSLLTDLDFSEYDHVLNATNVFNGWGSFNEVNGVTTAFVMGQGYVYPLIDYGKSNAVNRSFEFFIKHFRPSLFAREFLTKIFSSVGKTWTSNFLDSSFFKTLIIPSVENNELIDQAELDVVQFRAGYSTPQLISGAYSINLGSPPAYWEVPGLTNNLIMQDVTTPPNNDVSLQYNTASGIVQVGTTGDYDLVVRATIDYTITPLPGTVTSATDRKIRVELQYYNATTFVWDTIAFNELELSHSSLSESNIQISTIFSNTFLAGDFYKATFSNAGVAGTFLFTRFYDSLGNNILSGSASYNLQVTVGEFSMTKQSNLLDEGFTARINQSIPTLTKQRDFITSILNMFNLYMDVDVDNPNNYIIEPRNQFLKGISDAIDWTDKLDMSKTREILPMGDLNFKKFIYTYKQDSDYWNQLYFDNWKEVYGYKSFEVENQFVKGDNKTELLFAATPMVGNNANTTVIPAIYKKENDVYSPFKAKMRILQWGGMKLIYNNWHLKSGLSTTYFFDSYPYAGTADDPFFPTNDLGFGLYNELYYNFNSGVAYTLNNLFETYHKEGVRQISEKDSKILKAYFNLNQFDIRNLDFRNPIRVNTTYFYLNNIKNFNLLTKKTTQAELIKIL